MSEKSRYIDGVISDRAESDLANRKPTSPAEIPVAPETQFKPVPDHVKTAREWPGPTIPYYEKRLPHKLLPESTNR